MQPISGLKPKVAPKFLKPSASGHKKGEHPLALLAAITI